MMFAEGVEQPQFKLNEKLLLINWPFLLLITAITLVGVAALYSVAGGSLEPWASRHVVRYCLGLALLFVVALSDHPLVAARRLSALFRRAVHACAGDRCRRGERRRQALARLRRIRASSRRK